MNNATGHGIKHKTGMSNAGNCHRVMNYAPRQKRSVGIPHINVSSVLYVYSCCCTLFSLGATFIRVGNMRVREMLGPNLEAGSD